MRMWHLAAVLLLTGCAERLSACHCVMIDYAQEHRRIRGSATEDVDSGATCTCDARRKRSMTETSPPPKQHEPENERGDPQDAPIAPPP
jgi:hypothetical protein